MATNSKEIKKALRGAFPTVNFSVTYKYPYGYRIEWSNGVLQGATTEAVKAIAGEWDTSVRQDLGGGDYSNYGDSVRYYHNVTDENWKNFVVDCVLETACEGVYYDSEYKTFKNEGGSHVHHENKELKDYLENGVRTVLNTVSSDTEKEWYYKYEHKEQETKITYLESIKTDCSGTGLIGFLDSSVTVDDIKELYGEPRLELLEDDEEELAYQWVLRDKGNGYLVSLYVFKDEFEKTNYNLHIGGYSNADIELLKQDIPSDKVMSRQEFYELQDTQVETEPQPEPQPKYLSYYKTWVKELVESDRMTEIIDYQTWEDRYSQTIMLNEYKKFIESCIEEDRMIEIVDYESWLLSA